MYKMVIAVLLATLITSTQAVYAQSYDQTYFSNKWSRQQQNIAERCVVGWFAGATLAETSSNIVELVRVEALLSSTHSNDVTLLLPSIGEVDPQEVPGRILALMLEERGLSIAPSGFFEHQQFEVISRDTDTPPTMHELLEAEENENHGTEVANDEE